MKDSNPLTVARNMIANHQLAVACVVLASAHLIRYYSQAQAQADKALSRAPNIKTLER